MLTVSARKYLHRLLLLICTGLLLTIGTKAENEAAPAAVINAHCTIQINGAAAPSRLTDDNHYSYVNIPAGASVTITAQESIAGIYVEFNDVPGSWTVRTPAGSTEHGQDGFIHVYTAVNSFETELVFSEAVVVADIYLFSEGELPGWVQRWNPPWDRTDILMLPTHSDDDQLYFAGLIPTALEAGARVQVAYFTHHWDEQPRPHEQLDGLWACGLRNYPVMGLLRDSYSITRGDAAAILSDEGWTWEEIVGIQTELLRRFRPQVVVTHDINGEYGHGAHRLNTATMLEAAALSGDAQKFTESAETYGLWDVPKIYVHLYQEGRIVLNLDTPLESYGGKTAFQLAQDAFRFHESQMKWGGLRRFLYGHNFAYEIELYNPGQYGLWRTLVGPDTAGDTMLENIVLYDEQDALEAKAEQARAAAAWQAALLTRDEVFATANEVLRRATAEAARAALAELIAPEVTPEPGSAVDNPSGAAERIEPWKLFGTAAGLAIAAVFIVLSAGLIAAIARKKRPRHKHER